MRYFRRMMVQAQNRAVADPGNSGRQRDLSVSHINIGDMQSVQGDSKASGKSWDCKPNPPTFPPSSFCVPAKM